MASLLILLVLNGSSMVYDRMGDHELTIGVHLTLFVLTMLTVHSLPCVITENPLRKMKIANSIACLTTFEWITKIPCWVS